MATCSSILFYYILWTKEPGRLQYMELKELNPTEQLSTHTQRMHLQLIYKLATLKKKKSYLLRLNATLKDL